VLLAYVDKVLESISIQQRHGIAKEDIATWHQEVMNRYHEEAQDKRNYVISLESRKVIIDMARNFVVTTVDKNSQGLSVLCMKDYLRRLEEHMKSPTYTPTTKTAIDIINEHRIVNQKFGCNTSPALPYIKIIPKLHKEIARPFDRFIAGLSHMNRIDALDTKKERIGLPSSSLHHLSKKVSDFLNAVIDILLLQDKALIRKGEPKRVWIIRDTAEVIHVLQDSKKLYTHDFSTMYTNFPLEALYNSIEKQLVKAAKFLAVEYFKRDDTNFTKVIFMKPSRQTAAKALWKIGNPDCKKEWGVNQCLEALKYLLHNAYYSNRYGIVQQIVGIGMGCPHSPPASTIGLSAPEAEYVDRMLLTKGKEYVKVQLRNFKAYTRYIDDMGTESADIPSKTDYFDMDVIRTATCPPDESIDLLAYTFTPSPSGMSVSFKNKQSNFPVLLIRYPGHISTIPETSKVGSVVAGIISIYRVIDSPILFQAGIKEFFDILQARRFTVRTIRKGILKFLQRNCRREYIGFLLQHFFTDIIVNWPHRNDVPASRTVALAMMRHDLMLDVPQSWRERVARLRNELPIDGTQGPQDRLRHDHVDISIPQQTLTERTLPPPPIHRDKEGDTSLSSNDFQSCISDY
jgi:hypothetical protein